MQWLRSRVRFVTRRDRHAGGQPGVVDHGFAPVEGKHDAIGCFGFYNGQGALTSDTASMSAWRGTAVRKIVTTGERARAPILHAVDFTVQHGDGKLSRPTSTFPATIALLRTRIRKYGPSSQRRLPGKPDQRDLQRRRSALSTGQTRRQSSPGAGDWTGETAQTGTVNAIPGKGSHRRRMERS